MSRSTLQLRDMKSFRPTVVSVKSSALLDVYIERSSGGRVQRRLIVQPTDRGVCSIVVEHPSALCRCVQ